MHNRYQTMKRATVGTSVLGWVALICLVLNVMFWAGLMLDLLAPARIFSPQTLQAALSTAAFALILPLFWSMLLPSSPAGRLLQKQTWALPGQLAVTFGATFLTWLAFQWLRSWWAAQPNVAESGADLLLTVSSLIAGVLVPALAWCVTTPEQWAAQLEQARAVKRLEHAMKMEEAAMRASYARAVALLNADLTSLTLEQRRELGGILGAFARTQQTAMRQIAASWKDMYGVEAVLPSTPDRQLLAQYKEVTRLLTDGSEAFGDVADYAIVPASQAHQDTEWDAARDASQPSLRRRDDTPSVPARTHETPHSDAYEQARGVLDGAWKRVDLEQALSVSRSQAHRYLNDWQSAEVVRAVEQPRDHYVWS